MKLDSDTKARMWPELYEYLNRYFGAVFFGAMLCQLFNANYVLVLAGLLMFVFALLDWRTGFRAQKQRIADREDAIRWRNRHLDPEMFVDEDVKRLKEQGRVIQAIKLYRELHPDADLRTAKMAVDAL